MTDTVNDSEPAVRHVKTAIIGAGTAGHNAYRQVAKVTDELVIINEGIWTTTCTTMGCMPSKLMIAAAERAHHANHSDSFGIEGKAHINGKQVMKRVQEERDHFASYTQKNVESWNDDSKIYGRAVFNELGLIEVHKATGETELIKADFIIIATGSKPFVPEGWKDKLGNKLITSDDIFELNDLPKSMAVVGTGAIGLELAQAFSRLGVAVTIFNRSNQVGGIKDDKVNKKAIECLSNELNFKLHSSIDAVGTRQTDTDTVANINYTDSNGETHVWTGDLVLVATGRRNTIDKLGLNYLGVELDDQNRPKQLDKTTGQIADSNVYIVGDANAYRPLLHETSNEGYFSGKEVALRITGELDDSTLSEEVKNDGDGSSISNSPIMPDISSNKADDPSPLLSVIFSEPQIIAVGHTLKSMDEKGMSYVVGEVSFDNQGRSRIMGVNCGLLRIYAEKGTGEVLGACMVGPDAEYIAHILATAMTNKLSVFDLLESPFYHPTILEGLRTALRDCKDKLLKAENSSDD